LIKLLSPDARAERRLAICLALIAGYVDAYGLLVYGTYVSFMSGNTTQTGSMTGQGRLLAALPSALAILFFVAGSFAGTWLTHSRLRHSLQVLFGAIAALLAVIIGGTQLGNPALHAEVCIATLSLAMGSMNTTLSQIGAEPVNLTFVTGTLNKMGRHLALAITRAPLPDAQGQWDTHLRRAALMASVWAGFLTGAMVSGAATSYLGVGAWVLLPPFLILLALALVWVPFAPDNVPIAQPALLAPMMDPTTEKTEPRAQSTGIDARKGSKSRAVAHPGAPGSPAPGGVLVPDTCSDCEQGTPIARPVRRRCRTPRGSRDRRDMSPPRRRQRLPDS
jgi:uncharacterized membrane protein YoaK (UPF0700 family)